MPIFSKETLEKIRDRVDLVDLISSHLSLKKAGVTYKGLCPFHDEKNPSFVVQNHDRHYHCFGCGAHGDALQFLMAHLRYSFSDAVQFLGEKYGIPLELDEGDSAQSLSRQEMKRALELASSLFVFHLLHTKEGEEALGYLSARGIDRPFIERFQIGLAPRDALFKKWLETEKISSEISQGAGLFSASGRPFFTDRITFPIHSMQGTLIGFSARKFHESTFGGKYINTPETLLFKKSKILFGAIHSRKRIAKEQKALIVEGQIDCLRLIYEGFDYAVASQGTAFGQDHVKEMKQLGIKRAYLAFDADKAGSAATKKSGNLFIQQGIEVLVVTLPTGEDPDSFIRSKGKESFEAKLISALPFLHFLIDHEKEGIDPTSPHGKNEWVKKIMQSVTGWNQPLIEHESLKTISESTGVPLELLGSSRAAPIPAFVRKTAHLNPFEVDYDFILEKEFLFWWIQGEQNDLKEKISNHLQSEEFTTPLCKSAFVFLQEKKETPFIDALIECREPALQEFFQEITEKKVDRSKSKILAKAAFQKFLDRSWMKKREEIKKKMTEPALSDEEALLLAQQFSLLHRIEI